ncbi:carbohydrate-binding family 9-like protein [Desulfogranum marinum]|uniref:carbohydrate-binding family 9-like protein n=1 Tax=Desulfogranum marinum TaxID=453220 RepID=UPI0029C97ED0|nr:carbohydrate-binding family 9-like protein [Desulfogranum marinum]
MPITNHAVATKVQAPFSIEDSSWDAFPWKDLSSNLMQNHMGNKPVHFPGVEVKVAYDSMAIYLLFRVEDRYVRAVARSHQDDVYKDSCVEFFFTPGPDVSQGYFNIEMNCGGTMLFHFQKAPGKKRIIMPVNECNQIAVAHSLPKRVDPEIKNFVVWTVAYRVPLVLLKKYCDVVKPATQSFWRVNFYKCADNTSHPHWLTWAPVELPYPNFHHPSSFGFLYFK